MPRNESGRDLNSKETASRDEEDGGALPRKSPDSTVRATYREPREEGDRHSQRDPDAREDARPRPQDARDLRHGKDAREAERGPSAGGPRRSARRLRDDERSARSGSSDGSVDDLRWNSDEAFRSEGGRTDENRGERRSLSRGPSDSPLEMHRDCDAEGGSVYSPGRRDGSRGDLADERKEADELPGSKDELPRRNSDLHSSDRSGGSDSFHGGHKSKRIQQQNFSYLGRRDQSSDSLAGMPSNCYEDEEKEEGEEQTILSWMLSWDSLDQRKSGRAGDGHAAEGGERLGSIVEKSAEEGDRPKTLVSPPSKSSPGNRESRSRNPREGKGEENDVAGRSNREGRGGEGGSGSTDASSEDDGDADDDAAGAGKGAAAAAGSGRSSSANEKCLTESTAGVAADGDDDDDDPSIRSDDGSNGVDDGSSAEDGVEKCGMRVTPCMVCVLCVFYGAGLSLVGVLGFGAHMFLSAMEGGGSGDGGGLGTKQRIKDGMLSRTKRPGVAPSLRPSNGEKAAAETESAAESDGGVATWVSSTFAPSHSPLEVVAPSFRPTHGKKSTETEPAAESDGSVATWISSSFAPSNSPLEEVALSLGPSVGKKSTETEPAAESDGSVATRISPTFVPSHSPREEVAPSLGPSVGEKSAESEPAAESDGSVATWIPSASFVPSHSPLEEVAPSLSPSVGEKSNETEPAAESDGGVATWIPSALFVPSNSPLEEVAPSLRPSAREESTETEPAAESDGSDETWVPSTSLVPSYSPQEEVAPSLRPSVREGSTETESAPAAESDGSDETWIPSTLFVPSYSPLEEVAPSLRPSVGEKSTETESTVEDDGSDTTWPSSTFVPSYSPPEEVAPSLGPSVGKKSTETEPAADSDGSVATWISSSFVPSYSPLESTVYIPPPSTIPSLLPFPSISLSDHPSSVPSMPIQLSTSHSPSSNPSASASMQPSQAPSHLPSFSLGPTAEPECPEQLLKSAFLDDDGLLTMKYDVVLYHGDMAEFGGLLCISLEYASVTGWIGLALTDDETRDPRYIRKEAIIGIPGVRTSVAVATGLGGTSALGQQSVSRLAEGEAGPAFVNPGKYEIPAGISRPSLNLLSDVDRQTLINGTVSARDAHLDGGRGVAPPGGGAASTEISFVKYLLEPDEIGIDPYESTRLLYAVAPLDGDGRYDGNPEWKYAIVNLLDDSPDENSGLARKRIREHSEAIHNRL